MLLLFLLYKNFIVNVGICIICNSNYFFFLNVGRIWMWLEFYVSNFILISFSIIVIFLSMVNYCEIFYKYM